MENKFIRAEEVAQELSVSKPYAYKLIRQLNEELKAKGQDASFEEILHNVEERDRIDQSRAVSPLRKADDAILLDNSHLTIAEQKQWLKEQFEKAAHASH